MTKLNNTLKVNKDLPLTTDFRSVQEAMTRQFNSWKNKHRDSEGLTNSFDKTLQSFRSRRKF
jgi:hypothetical protein